MWDIFEHFKFIKHLFNYRDSTVIECSAVSAVWSVIINAIMLITGWFEYFADNVLGISVFLIVMIFIVMLIDLFSGLAASRKEGKKRTSKKGLRWVFKMGSYILFIYVINAFVKEALLMDQNWLAVPLSVIKLYLIFHIIMWETKSIEENFRRLGYNTRIFGMMAAAYKNIKRIFSKNPDVGIKDDESS